MRTKLSILLKPALLIGAVMCCFSCAKTPQSVEQSSNSEIQIQLLFEKDGCKVYRFYDCGHAVYFTDCRGKVEYEYYQSNGKSGQNIRVQNESVK